MTQTAQLGLASAVVLLATTTPSYAYLDPGTASIAIQAVIAAIAAGGVTAGIYWNKLRSLFGWKKPDPELKKSDK